VEIRHGRQGKKKDPTWNARKERRHTQLEKDKERSVIVADKFEEEHQEHQRQLKASMHMEITTDCILGKFLHTMRAFYHFLICSRSTKVVS
jgi:hypothetical protein